MWRKFVPLVACAIIGCGSSDREMREQSLSILNTEADRWDGSKVFATSAVDAYGHPLSASVEKGIINYTLELRSNGRDGLPKNTDDIKVTRAKPHAGPVVTDQAVLDVEKVSSGIASGALKGIKKELGFGRKDKK